MYIKCPYCGINYMNENQEMCDVCTRDKKAVFIDDELCEICGAMLQYNEYKICGECMSK